jgi:hypothetical protein
LLADSFDSLAGGNLAFIEAGQHHDAEAMRLWDSVFSHDPVQLGAGLNLAVVACGTGQRSVRRGTALERLLVFSPDNEKAQAMLANIRAGTGKLRRRINLCTARPSSSFNRQSAGGENVMPKTSTDRCRFFRRLTVRVSS